MERIKITVSKALNIDTTRLNEISLEDIEIDRTSQNRIYQALYHMAVLGSPTLPLRDSQEPNPGVPCTTFWIEDTQELVLFAWSQDKTKTIIIPPEEWFLREDITIH